MDGLSRTMRNLVMKEKITQFFTSPAFAVLGASSRRHKYGNKVLRCYMQHHKRVIPVNPVEENIEGLPVVRKIADLPAEVKSISVVTSPAVTEKLVEEAIEKGIENIWMQPGAHSALAIERCERAGINVIAGPCILQFLGFVDE